MLDVAAVLPESAGVVRSNGCFGDFDSARPRAVLLEYREQRVGQLPAQCSFAYRLEQALDFGRKGTNGVALFTYW